MASVLNSGVCQLPGAEMKNTSSDAEGSAGTVTEVCGACSEWGQGTGRTFPEGLAPEVGLEG